MSSQPKVIPVVGVIGGIGSGKSAVAQRLRELSWTAGRRIEVVDADQLGHQVLRLPHVIGRIREQFGDVVFESVPRPPGSGLVDQNTRGECGPLPDGRGTEFGEISRFALARIVFGPDAAAEAARRDLQRIVWPEIRSLAERQIRELRQRGEVAAILLDAAVLLEAGWNSACDLVAFIDTPDAVRLARVQAGRGWTADELAKREASQWPLARKRAAADVIIDNSSNVDDAAKQLEQAITDWKSENREI